MTDSLQSCVFCRTGSLRDCVAPPRNNSAVGPRRPACGRRAPTTAQKVSAGKPRFVHQKCFFSTSQVARAPRLRLRSAVRVSVTLIRVCPPSLTRAFASRIAYRPRFSLACGVPRRQVVRGLLALSLVVPLPLVLGCSGASPVHLIYVPAYARALSARAPPRASSAMCPVLCVHMPRSGVADPCALHPCARRRGAARRGTV